MTAKEKQKAFEKLEHALAGKRFRVTPFGEEEFGPAPDKTGDAEYFLWPFRSENGANGYDDMDVRSVEYVYGKLYYCAVLVGEES